jgi:hypothetical protein
MAEFDFAAAHKKITEINKIVETCPETVKEKAFELLFRMLFDKPVAASSHKSLATPKPDPAEVVETMYAERLPRLRQDVANRIADEGGRG